MDYNIFNLYDRDWSFKEGTSSETNRKDKQRVKQTIAFLLDNAATQDQKRFFSEAKPSTDSSVYQEWFTKLQHASRTIQSEGVKVLHQLEKELEEELASNNYPVSFKAPSTAPKHQVTGFHSRLEKYHSAKPSKSSNIIAQQFSNSTDAASVENLSAYL